MNGVSDFLFGCISLALMVSGCVAVGGSKPQCRAGNGFPVPELSAVQACDQFMSRLSDVLGEAGSGDIAGDHEFDLTVTGKGTITSVISRSGARQLSDYPPVSVDAMDRTLEKGDIDRLAEAVAGLLLEQFGADRATP